MPNKGQAWQWDPVTVVDRDGTTREMKVIGSCNTGFTSASYYRDDGYGNHIVPDGSATSGPNRPPAASCDEASTKQWAIEQYPTRTS